MTDSPMAPDSAVQGGDSPGLIPPIIGTLLLLLPVVTAVQAWLANAPGKGWISIFAVAALAIGVAGWWFFRGFVFLIGLLAAGALIVSIAYLYGSESAVLSIAGMPLRLFVPVLFLAALALAAWKLARLPKLPLWARFIAPALAVFASVPVVMGLIEGVPFVEVLVGLWTLPYWTQGAWFGAAILLPLALIVVLLRAAVPAWRDEPFRPAVALTAIIALLTASLATGFTMTSRDLVNLTAFVPVPGLKISEPVTERTSNLDPVGSAGESNQRVANPINTRTAETEIQRDTPAISKNEISPEAKHPRARIDRSRIDVSALQESIGQSIEELAKFVQDETQFQPYEGLLRGSKGTLLAKAGNSIDRAVLLADLLHEAGYKSRFVEGSLERSRAEKLILNSMPRKSDDSLLRGDKPIDDVVVGAWGHFILMGDTLVEAGHRGTVNGHEEWQRAVASVQEHVWLQVKMDTGKWVDIDPTPGVTFGGTLADADRIFDVVPSEREFKLRFLVRAGDDVLMDVNSSAHLLAGIPITLFYESVDSNSHPVLMIGDERFRGKSFAGAAPKRRGGLGAFGGLRMQENEKPDRIPLSLEVHIIGPQESRVSSHEVLGPNDDLDTILGISVVSGTVPFELPAAILTEVGDPLTERGVGRLLNFVNFGYYVLRQEMPNSFMLPFPLVYTDFPNVTISRVGRPPASEAVQLRIDLATKSYKIIRSPTDEIGFWATYFDYLSNGVFDHEAERALLGWPETESSVGALFEATVNSDIPIRVLDSVDDLGLGLDFFPQYGLDRIRTTLESGQLVLVPQRPPGGWQDNQLGWWSVDARTGWTEDSNVHGLHSVAEKTKLESQLKLKRDVAMCVAAITVFGVGVQIAEIVALHEGGPHLSDIVADAGDAIRAIWRQQCKKAKVKRIEGRAKRAPPTKRFKNERYQGPVQRGPTSASRRWTPTGY